MDIIERKDAINRKMTQYFTGRPCKNGHIATRYTMSGTCSECISEANAGIRATLSGDGRAVQTREMVTLKREAIGQLVELKVRVYYEDWATVRDTAVGLCLARYPSLLAHNVVSHRAPSDIAGGTGLYKVRIPAEDVQLIRDVANALFNAHTVDMKGVRDRISHQLDTLVDAEAVPVPDWANRP